MAVHTEVSEPQLREFLRQYDVGGLLNFNGVAEGSENTTYLVETEAGKHVLTLYEQRTDADDLPYALGLAEHLAAKGIPAPAPRRMLSGKLWGTVADRPAALAAHLPGKSVRKPVPEQCRQVGRMLAQLHLQAADFGGRRANNLSVKDWRPLFAKTEAAGELRDLILAELDFLEANWPADLPAGPIHADLFPDNVLFAGGRISGVIDFGFACDDLLAYDLAICVNAWCCNADGTADPARYAALAGGYNGGRMPALPEARAFRILKRGANLRFLLTRLHDSLHRPDAAKDPAECVRRLRVLRSG